MSYFPKGHHDASDDINDFDEFDPTPYGGGYDIFLTYGRPLRPSDETCYRKNSSASIDFDYDHPQYNAHAKPSAYGVEALDNEYKSYTRPKPRPGPLQPTYCYDGAKPDYGSHQDVNRPGGRYGGENEYGSGGGSEFGPGNGGRTESEYGRKPGDERPSSEYGSGYGRKPKPEYGGSEYGSGYGRKPESGGPYGRKSGYGEEESGGGYGRRPEKSEYGEEKPNYVRPSHERPSYGRSEEEDYRKPNYGRSEEEYRKPSYQKHDDDDDNEGYGRKKYGDDKSDDDDDDEKKHHRKHYDD